MTRFARAAVALSLALLWPLPASPVEIEGVEYAEEIEAAGTSLRLQGVALLNYKVLFKAYTAALYLGEGVDPADVLGDTPKRLELAYFWSIDGEKFGPAGVEILSRNVDEATLTALRPRLDRIGALYEDVEPGDRYALTYIPGMGTELAKNGRRIGTIPGADFAAAYFAIWLGAEPLDAKLRDRLLGSD